MSDLVERLREEALEADKEAWRRLDGGHEYTMGAMLAEEAADRIEQLEEENARMRAALEWYADMATDCRKITSEGDIARRALDKDGGDRARFALAAEAAQ